MRITISLAAALLAALSAPAQMVSPNLERGFDPQKAYALEEIGVVNVFNGNLNVTLPIGANYPVSSTLSYGVGLQYGGNNWEYDTIEEPLLDEDGEPICQIGDNGECRLVMQTYGWSYPSPYDNAGFGWRLHFGRLLPEGTKGGNMSAYESPDGAVHTFYPRLHDTDAGVPAGTFYTRDGSYLRMKLDGDHVTVESPNGTIREFDVTTGHVSNGGAVAIRDAFGNSVEIDYDYTGPAPLPRFAGTYRVWRIHDSVGRNHYVYLRPAATYHEEFPPAPVTHWSVGEVRLQMPGNHAVWEFHYAGETGAPPAWASLGRPCMDVPPYINVGERVQAALLEKVVPPAGNAYTFSYDVSDYDTGACHESSGALKSVTLPTLGRVEWKYTLNHYPPNPTAVTNHKNPPGLYKSLAVQHRTVRNANNVVTGYREYETVSDKSLPGQPALEQKVTVTDYTNDEKTTILRKSENFFSLCNSENCVARGEYALPFTRKDLPDREETDVQGRHLSTITYGLNGDWSRPFQRTYVAYEADIALNTAARGIVDYNRRLKSQRTVHYTSSASEWIDNLSHGFDGLGHYRVTEVKASFGATSRTTRQNFNPAAGEYAIGGGTFVLPSSWVLGLFDFVEVTDTGSGGMTTHRTDYCFGSTGFLERKRTRRFASEPKRDLLAVFSGVAGDVTREEYYGGDETELPAAVTCTSSLGQVPKYAVNHSYIYGVRSTSQHDGTSFLSMDLDVDSSGLVVASRDTAGKPTTFKYDPLGRIEEIRPDGVAWTQYQYIAAGNASNPATVIARQWPHGSAAGGTALTETRYFYDHLGRLVQQRNWMSGVAADPWSAVRTSYDALGRNVGTSVATGVSTGAFSGFTAPETVTAYDALGRVIATTQPDGSQATIVHTGASTVERTIRIATSSTEETSVSTQERMDGLGRLVSIVENEHVEHGVQKGVETTYRYDPADRLTQVLAGIQTRTFQYDGAGLLTSESHPETVGATTYLYDSRGHV
ncbi:MAG TPA: hypothetical protein VEO54_03045, partial [Thermoanaerobaculia bacterium]|nr:hypothetical protein [Thermoanaerobaculia bacterium]